MLVKRKIEKYLEVEIFISVELLRTIKVDIKLQTGVFGIGEYIEAMKHHSAGNITPTYQLGISSSVTVTGCLTFFIHASRIQSGFVIFAYEAL